MKSDIIVIDSQGNGFRDAVNESRKAAEYRGLNRQDSLHLEMITEEMLSMARSVTGEMEASFWIENEGRQFTLCLMTKTVMNSEKRYQLISSSSSRKNEAAKSFLGKLRDTFEQAMASEVDKQYDELPNELLSDISGRTFEDPEWDGYERSVLLKLADDVKIGIRGGVVTMTISKNFAEE